MVMNFQFYKPSGEIMMYHLDAKKQKLDQTDKKEKKKKFRGNKVYKITIGRQRMIQNRNILISSWH